MTWRWPRRRVASGGRLAREIRPRGDYSTAHKALSVEESFPWRPGLETLVHPQVLRRAAPHFGFDPLVHAQRIGLGIVAGPIGQRRQEAHAPAARLEHLGVVMVTWGGDWRDRGRRGRSRRGHGGRRLGSTIGLPVGARCAYLFLLNQDKKVDVNISTDKGGNWYAQPWVWIVGGAVFLLLLVALMRGNSNKD